MAKPTHTVVPFLGDRTYSITPQIKIEQFAHTDLDKKRCKGDPKVVAAALSPNSPPTSLPGPPEDTNPNDSRINKS